MATKEPETSFNQHLARIAVGGYDDAQQTRKAMMNRIRDIVRKVNEDIPFDEVEDEKDDESYDSKYRDEHLPELVGQLADDGALAGFERDYLMTMIEAVQSIEDIETRYKSVMEITEREPIYDDWLRHVNGVSTTLTAKLIHRFGYCGDYPKVSNLWSYSGLAPNQDRERGEHLGYSPDAKTLAWLVADRIIMQGDRSHYKREFYDPYKEKQLDRMEMADEMTDAELEQVDWTPPESRGHADNRSRRYLAKKFLKHYWAIARDLKGYETPDEWVLTHGGHEKRTDTFENPFYARREIIEPE